MKLPINNVKYLPLWFIGIALILFVLLIQLGPSFNPVPVIPTMPTVEVIEVKRETTHVPVYSQGVINPHTEIELSADVAGRITEVSSKLANGRFFAKDDILLKLDTTNYLVEIERAKSAVATSKLSLKQARSRGATALIEEAKARLAAANATLRQARSMFDKTKVKAPFNGRVREKRVGLGQYATPGLPIARIFATDLGEIRLPLSDEQMGLVNIPVAFETDDEENTSPQQGSKVEVTARFGGKPYTWSGRLVRAEGAVNEANRLLYVVAEIPAAFAPDPDDPERPLLAAGLYMQAKIEGRLLKDVIVLPRRLLRNEDKVLTVDSENRMKLKQANVIYRGRDMVFIREGLEPGERVITTPVELVVEGVQVRIAGEEPAPVVPTQAVPVQPKPEQVPATGTIDQPQTSEQQSAVGGGE